MTARCARQQMLVPVNLCEARRLSQNSEGLDNKVLERKLKTKNRSV